MQTYSLHIVGMDRHERLKVARLRKFDTATEAAKFFGIPYGTYTGHEAGTRGIKHAELERYAKAFRVPLSWLAYGQGTLDDDPNVTPIIGIAGAGPNGSVDYSVGQGPLGEAPMPPGATKATVALEVRGQSMPGVANDGWLIYYDDRHEPPTDEMLGELCIVSIKDGETLVKFLHRGSRRGRFNLESTGAPTMRDQRVAWAALVTAIIPKKTAQRLRVRAAKGTLPAA